MGETHRLEEVCGSILLWRVDGNHVLYFYKAYVKFMLMHKLNMLYANVTDPVQMLHG